MSTRDQFVIFCNCFACDKSTTQQKNYKNGRNPSLHFEVKTSGAPWTVGDPRTSPCNPEKNSGHRAVFCLIWGTVQSGIQETGQVGDGVDFSWCGYFFTVWGWILIIVLYKILTALRGTVKIIGPRWCQNHDYAWSEAECIVMVLTSPRAYNFNCASNKKQSIFVLYTEWRKKILSFDRLCT